MLPVLSLFFFLSYLSRQYTGSYNPTVKQQIQWQRCWDYSFYTISGWLKFAYVTNPVPLKMRRITYKLHSQGHSCFCFCFFYTLGIPHTRHICTRFELWSRPFHLSLEGVQFTQLCCHISFFSFVRLIIYFLSRRGRLLNSCKCQLFCLHIHHTTHLFERQTSVGLSEAAVCRFYLSISLHGDKWYSTDPASFLLSFF